MRMIDLVSKYNIPAPRYTSYPTVPYWEDNINEDIWKEHIKNAFVLNNKDGISLYIHLPFCESLCTYCACNTRITVNHKVEIPYIDALIKEWHLYLNEFDYKPIIKEIHLGGGTPTFFSHQNLEYLLRSILSTCNISDDSDFSFEGHPSNTSHKHLQTLFDLGFKRISLGVQDFDSAVQQAINRYQTFQEVKAVVDLARRIGYTSINIDLVYGLPHQTFNSVQSTISQIISLQPERIAFYSYAHVPWLRPGQRKYTEADIPQANVKRQLYEAGKNMFSDAGYKDIGMDHFAKPNDELFKAFNAGTLHRNFMGYTTNRTKLLVGLGCSAVSDTWTVLSQNIKTVEEYYQAIEQDKFPISKGHVLHSDDILIRQHILNLMCKHKTNFSNTLPDQLILKEALENLSEPISDKLIYIKGNEAVISEKGKSFLRNICLAFDKRYWQKQPSQRLFSTTA
jgi:oxygen-independent coproporphyrinogen III oxidase